MRRKKCETISIIYGLNTIGVAMADIHSDLTRIKLLKTLLIHCTTHHAFPRPEILLEPLIHHVCYHEMYQQR